MSLKLLFCVSLICIVQASHGTIVNGISKSTKEKLRQTIEDTIEAKRQSAVEVDAVKNLFERKVEIALEPVEKEIRKLKCRVKRAEKNTKETEADISKCVKEVRKSLTKANEHKEKVEECKITKETISSGEKLGEIGGLVGFLRSAPTVCATKGILANTCVMSMIDHTREKVLVLQNEISVILRHIKQEDHEKCTSKGIEKLEKQVEDAEDSWVECLEKHGADTDKSE